MKILEGTLNTISCNVRNFWHIIQDIVCLSACILASSDTFPYHKNGSNLFLFFTILTGIIFLYNVFRSDLHMESVRKMGAWGVKYRCFYAIYYPTISFICASLGGFKGYLFAFIWLLSGGTYLVVADKIAKEEMGKQDKVAEEILGHISDAESGCPYCKSNKYEVSYSKHINLLKANHNCLKCKKHWNQIFKYSDTELIRQELNVSNTSNVEAEEIFG